MRGAAWLVLAACSRAPTLTPAEAAPPLEPEAPAPVSELDSRAGFGVLSEGEGDAGVRALALRFVAALAEENTGQLRVLLQHASWQPGIARGTPLEELSRRFALYEFQTLRLPLAQGELERMQVRAVDATRWDVRLPQLALSEPLFVGRPVLRIAGSGDTLRIESYGED